MSLPHGPLPSTLRTFLFGADSVGALADSFVEVSLGAVERTVVDKLGPEALDALRHHLARAAADFINVDPARILADGLRRHRELVAVAEQTVASGGTALVPLGAHRITLTQRPAVDVELGGEQVATVTFELSVRIELDGVSAIVRAGSLVELEGGPCELHAAFVLEPDEVLAHQGVSFDANAAVPLGKGIRLSS